MKGQSQVGLLFSYLFSIEDTNLNKGRQNSIKDLHVSITQLQHSKVGLAFFSCSYFVLWCFHFYVHWMKHLTGEWAEGAEKFLKYPYQLMTGAGRRSLDSFCPSIAQVIGRASAWNCRAEKHLRDHWHSPSLSRHDSRGLARSGIVLRADTAREKHSWPAIQVWNWHFYFSFTFNF